MVQEKLHREGEGANWQSERSRRKYTISVLSVLFLRAFMRSARQWQSSSRSLSLYGACYRT